MAAGKTLYAVRLLILLALLVTAPFRKADAVNVTFQLEKLVDFGQGFVIAGNVAPLGNWDPAQAAFMTVTGDRDWSVTVDLVAASTVEYKPVKIVYDTRQVLEWLPGNNLVLNVPSKGPIYVSVNFP
ncbi:hypothetical protein KP509_01G126400 [Ceratopteris richardii]|uniref:CBM20 domain-containing protein n=1 Tax=Ceratopteris richardii TaxID=49495 RepID=A0A8T2VHA2_CERRI|nr:hypothetical protein KP509_01G126400 [Ceratopteris richardii]